MSKIQCVKNVFVLADLDTTATFTYNVNGIGFQPDEMIVKSIALSQATPTNNIYLVWCDLVQGFIGSAMDSSTNTPYTIFKMSQPISGLQQIQFKMYSAYSTAVASITDTNIAIQLEFVKYNNKN